MLGQEIGGMAERDKRRGDLGESGEWGKRSRRKAERADGK